MPKQQLLPSSEYRILVLGDKAVGKTSLIARYVRNEFPYQKRLHINSDNSTIYQTIIDGTDYTFIFCDISTISEFEKLKLSDTIPTACLILFSITDEKSFTQLNFFYETIRLKFSNQSLHVPILIVANKIDLEHDRAVKQESIDKLKSSGFDVYDISIKGNVGIGDVIYTAVKHLQYDILEKVKPDTVCACIIT
ncbi:unnamed protein product [Adineta steineri]|uniref:small monomeric GTPase n=1 Tax=Adineta steineri TaxID=433720 RepID=A0A818P5M7_9BILA|nr:unnamed protein product [Adineta steineri]CAF1079941.1 unnamed protein product [Adineta steineri]CAF1266297.1 unnamed protein product [Adineta steineri]CAF1344542.1 unnamed protein product [Adineta steineri]CAF3617291.1 unnamed protein product [Adineta steineri]